MKTTPGAHRAERATNRPDDADAGDERFDLYDTPGYMVRRLHQIVVSLCHAQWGELDLTPVQYAALMAIRAYPGVDQRRLSRAIAYDRSTTGSVVEQLERRGLVDRRPGRSDRRVKELTISEDGRALLAHAQALAADIQDRLLAPLGARDRRTFVRLLRTLVDENNSLSRAPLDPLAPNEERPGRQGTAQPEGSDR